MQKLTGLSIWIIEQNFFFLNNWKLEIVIFSFCDFFV